MLTTTTTVRSPPDKRAPLEIPTEEELASYTRYFKICPKCTFHNGTGVSECEVCRNALTRSIADMVQNVHHFWTEIRASGQYASPQSIQAHARLFFKHVLPRLVLPVMQQFRNINMEYMALRQKREYDLLFDRSSSERPFAHVDRAIREREEKHTTQQKERQSELSSILNQLSTLSQDVRYRDLDQPSMILVAARLAFAQQQELARTCSAWKEQVQNARHIHTRQIGLKITTTSPSQALMETNIAMFAEIFSIIKVIVMRRNAIQHDVNIPITHRVTPLNVLLTLWKTRLEHLTLERSGTIGTIASAGWFNPKYVNLERKDSKITSLIFPNGMSEYEPQIWHMLAPNLRQLVVEIDAFDPDLVVFQRLLQEGVSDNSYTHSRVTYEPEQRHVIRQVPSPMWFEQLQCLHLHVLEPPPPSSRVSFNVMDMFWLALTRMTQLRYLGITGRRLRLRGEKLTETLSKLVNLEAILLEDVDNLTVEQVRQIAQRKTLRFLSIHLEEKLRDDFKAQPWIELGEELRTRHARTCLVLQVLVSMRNLLNQKAINDDLEFVHPLVNIVKRNWANFLQKYKHVKDLLKPSREVMPGRGRFDTEQFHLIRAVFLPNPQEVLLKQANPLYDLPDMEV